MAEILRLRGADEAAVAARCADFLERGGLAVLPTDTVYGLAARADMPQAVRAVFEAKGRKTEKALVVMVSALAEALALAAPRMRPPLRRLGTLWPGPLTLVVEAEEVPWKEQVAPGSKTLGIRIPDSGFLLRLLGMCGPLAVTSANPAGGPEPASFRDVGAELLCAAAVAVDAGRCGSGQPSTVAAVTGSGFEILRPGQVGEDMLRRALAGDRANQAAAVGEVRAGEEGAN